MIASDPNDAATDLEERERASNIERARRTIPIHERPSLDCWDCSGIEQDAAKGQCEHYAACLADWDKEKRMQRIIGKSE
jgi:hypothetical protein